LLCFSFEYCVSCSVFQMNTVFLALFFIRIPCCLLCFSNEYCVSCSVFQMNTVFLTLFFIWIPCFTVCLLPHIPQPPFSKYIQYINKGYIWHIYLCSSLEMGIGRRKGGGMGMAGPKKKVSYKTDSFKRQYQEIFGCWFFSSNSFSWSHLRYVGTISIFAEYSQRYWNIILFPRCKIHSRVD